MARKKKVEETVVADNTNWPKIEKGSHLTVTTFEDGSTKLEWDWDALVRDVNEATSSISTNIVEVTEAKVKKSRAKKSKVTE